MPFGWQNRVVNLSARRCKAGITFSDMPDMPVT